MIFGVLTVGGTAALLASGCSTLRSVFALDGKQKNQGPIHNPFDAYYPTASHENIILRTKKGDRSIEVELPNGSGQMSDFVVPMSPAFQEPSRHATS